MKFLFIINPISGGKAKGDWEGAIRSFFKERPDIIEFYMLQEGDNKRSIEHYIERFSPDRVVAVGGDGTVKMVADLLKETTMAMGILPAGSANGMAKELGIPVIAEEALQVVADGEVKKIDVIRINEEHLCIHLSDIGLNAMLVKSFENSKSRGMWGYGKAVFSMLWNKVKMRVTIKTDEGEVKRKAYMVTIANARKYGTGANINPEGSVSDGKFEVVVVRKLNVIAIMKSIFTDRSFHPEHIEVISTTNADIAVQRKAYFQIDGECMDKTSRINARILPQILQVLVPPEPGEKLA